MKTSISFLPKINQEQILQIVEIIKEVIPAEKIILFGSYAKGKQVEHKYQVKDGTTFEYTSDYDILVILKEIPEKLFNLESAIINKTDKYNAPVNLEIHRIDYVNKGLEIGEYFFVDIVKEGVLLYDTGSLEFATPHELTPQERQKKAKRYFNIWFPSANKMIKGSKFYFTENDLKESVFLLHQATESLYYTVLLIFTDYKPKLHNLWKLRKKTKPYSEELFLVFCAEMNEYDNHIFDLLKRGYIDARYREDYVITKNELKNLIDKVTSMMTIVEKICREKIAALIQGS
jgi:predicted nucleotidyltransferase/HEPN domain-containing protein